MKLHWNDFLFEFKTNRRQNIKFEQFYNIQNNKIQFVRSSGKPQYFYFTFML